MQIVSRYIAAAVCTIVVATSSFAIEPINYQHWSSASPETKQLIELSLNGLGGEQVLNRVHSIRRVGSVSESGTDGREITRFDRLWISPQKLYIRVDTNGRESRFTLSALGAHLFPGDPKIPGSAVRLTDEETAAFLAPVKDDPIHVLINRSNLAYGFAAGAAREFDGQNVQILHVNAEGREFEWWIAKDSGRILKIRRDANESARRDFREAEGLIIPFEIVSTAADGSSCRTRLERLEVNRPEAEAELFRKPELIVMRLKEQPRWGRSSYGGYSSSYGRSSSSSQGSSSRKTFLDDPSIPVRVGDHYMWGGN